MHTTPDSNLLMPLTLVVAYLFISIVVPFAFFWLEGRREESRELNRQFERQEEWLQLHNQSIDVD